MINVYLIEKNNQNKSKKNKKLFDIKLLLRIIQIWRIKLTNFKEIK